MRLNHVCYLWSLALAEKDILEYKGYDSIAIAPTEPLKAPDHQQVGSLISQRADPLELLDASAVVQETESTSECSETMEDEEDDDDQESILEEGTSPQEFNSALLIESILQTRVGSPTTALPTLCSENEPTTLAEHAPELYSSSVPGSHVNTPARMIPLVSEESLTQAPDQVYKETTACREKIFSHQGPIQTPPAPKQPYYYYPVSPPVQAPYPDLSGLVGIPGLTPGVVAQPGSKLGSQAGGQAGGVYVYPEVIAQHDIHGSQKAPGQNMGPGYSNLNPYIHPPAGQSPLVIINPFSPLFSNQGRPIQQGSPGNRPYPGQGQQAPPPAQQIPHQGNAAGSLQPIPNPLAGLGNLGELGALGSLGGLGGLAGLTQGHQPGGNLPGIVGGPYLPPVDDKETGDAKDTEFYVDKVPAHAPLEHAVDHSNGKPVKESGGSIQNKQVNVGGQSNDKSDVKSGQKSEEALGDPVPAGLLYSTEEVDTMQTKKYAFDGSGFLTYDAMQGNWYVSVNGTSGDPELLTSNRASMASMASWKCRVWAVLFSLV